MHQLPMHFHATVVAARGECGPMAIRIPQYANGTEGKKEVIAR